MEENRSFSVIGSLPAIQSAIAIGKDSVRLKLDIPLHNQEQRNSIMLLQSLMNCVFKLTFTIEETNQQDYFYPKPKQEIQEPEPAEEPQDENVPEQEIEYQEPDIIEQVKKLRWKIHAELMAAGCELEQSRVCEALVGEKRLHHCTLEQTQKIWEFMCDGAAIPSINRTSLRSRVLKLIGEVS